MKTPKYVIVYGPPRSGKTLNKELLKKFFECDDAFDEGFEDSKIDLAVGRVLILADEEPHRLALWWPDSALIPVQEAAFLLRDKGWVTAKGGVA